MQVEVENACSAFPEASTLFCEAANRTHSKASTPAPPPKHSVDTSHWLGHHDTLVSLVQRGNTIMPTFNVTKPSTLVFLGVNEALFTLRWFVW